MAILNFLRKGFWDITQVKKNTPREGGHGSCIIKKNLTQGLKP